jgi:hypothetical protein
VVLQSPLRRKRSLEDDDEVIDVTPKAARVGDINFGNGGSCTNNVFNGQVSGNLCFACVLLAVIFPTVCFVVFGR